MLNWTENEIVFLTAKLGGGKSFLATLGFIWAELLKGKRTICTNVALNLPEIWQTLYDREQRDDIDVESRIRLLTHEQCFAPWLYGGRMSDGTWWDSELAKHVKEDGKMDKEHDKAGIIPDLDKRPGSCLYVIDEAHFFFRPENFMTMSRVAKSYLTHVRRLGDTFVIITPHPNQIVKPIRDMMCLWITTSNLRKMRMMAWGGPKTFWVTERTSWSEAVAVNHEEMVQFKPWVGKLYNTGVGNGARGAADINHKRKGLPWWTAPALLVGVVVLLLSLMWFAPRAIMGYLGGMRPKQMLPGERTLKPSGSGGTPGLTPQTVPFAPVVHPATQYVVLVMTNAFASGPPERKRDIDAIAWVNGSPIVIQDGERVLSHRLGWVSPQCEFAVIDGIQHWLRKPDFPNNGRAKGFEPTDYVGNGLARRQ